MDYSWRIAYGESMEAVNGDPSLGTRRCLGETVDGNARDDLVTFWVLPPRASEEIERKRIAHGVLGERRKKK